MTVTRVAIGQRYGHLTVIARDTPRVFPSGRSAIQWRCQCDCGTETVVLGWNLTTGHTSSCGCERDKSMARVGSCGGLTARFPDEYRIWGQLRRRCYVKDDPGYDRYGGRGIAVCDSWRGIGSFVNFMADMGPRPGPEYSIDRYPDNDGNYEPGNCRWATEIEQQNNRRDNLLIIIDGEKRTLAEWCRSTGVDYHTALGRIRRGIDPREALQP